MSNQEKPSDDSIKLCGKKRNCSKILGHCSKCDSKRSFNESFLCNKTKLTSSLNREKDEISFLQETSKTKETEHLILLEKIQQQQKEICDKSSLLSQTNEELHSANEKLHLLLYQKEKKYMMLVDEVQQKKVELKNLCQKAVVLRQKNKKLLASYKKVRILFEKKGYVQKRKENVPTDASIIYSSTSSTKYRRRRDSFNVMKYIHGGCRGLVYGCWDLIVSSASVKEMEEFILSYRRGQFLQNFYYRINEKGLKTEDAMKKAVTEKYMVHLSSRKYSLLCHIQAHSFQNRTVKNGINIDYGEFNIDIKTKALSNQAVTKFVNSLNIGDVSVIHGCCGASRTVTGLITMISDLHFKVDALKSKMIWFNNNRNHYVVEFSDDGAPESKEKSMSIGTLSFLNFGKRIRSRQFHYILHAVTAGEKDDVCKMLWRQHTDEMLLIEGNTFYINNEKSTFEFIPSADTAWVVFANNCLSCSATYPSPFANVHKEQLNKRGATIGRGSNTTYTIPSTKSRKLELNMLEDFKRTFSSTLSEKLKHKMILEFMASNGIRQLGDPVIGEFADRFQPEPLHLEINSWQHLLDLLYKEAVRRNKFNEFLTALKNPINNKVGESGCGLKFIAKGIEEHYSVINSRFKKLKTRLIGAQAISLARYSNRIVDILSMENESGPLKVRRLALSKLCEMLRDIGVLINRVDVKSTSYTTDVFTVCRQYFDLFSLFFPQNCNVTVWTVGYAIPFFVAEFYKKFGVGYGMISMQGKESKHSEIKMQLRFESNRSESNNKKSKWFQLMRTNFVRNFYIPYHFPLVSTYHSHYLSRNPVKSDSMQCTSCSRNLDSDKLCQNCIDCIPLIECVVKKEIIGIILDMIKPVRCPLCTQVFSDETLLRNHKCVSLTHISNCVILVPQDMTNEHLKSELSKRNQPTNGTRAMLIRRLDNLLE